MHFYNVDLRLGLVEVLEEPNIVVNGYIMHMCFIFWLGPVIFCRRQSLWHCRYVLDECNFLEQLQPPSIYVVKDM